MLMNGCIASTEEDRLIEHLFFDSSYNKLSRPAVKETDEVEVAFGITLMSIDEYDLASEKLTIDVWENHVSKYELCIMCSITMIQMSKKSLKVLALMCIFPLCSIINW